jgi:hypothetical protein
MRPFSLAAAAAAAGALGVAVWYGSGPAQNGWAARAGTPTVLLAAKASSKRILAAASPIPSLPRSFAAALSGQLTQSLPDASGMITVRIDATLSGRVRGRLRLTLLGAPTDGGGVVMSSSGAAFAANGRSPLYEGSIVALNGTSLVADLQAPSAGSLRLAIVLHIDPGSGALSGSVRGVRK